MAGFGSDIPPEVEPGSSDLGMLLNTAKAVRNGSIAAFDEFIEVGEPVLGTFGFGDSQGNELGGLSGAAEGSRASTNDATGTDDGVVFKNFKHFPLEVRSMIWKAAAEAAKPCGVYHFTYKKMLMGPGPRYPHLSDTVLTNLHRISPSNPLARSIHDLLLWSYYGESILTFTPSATAAGLTRAVRNVLRSCSEARTEIMRSPTLSSSFDFHYMKGGKCNLGTIRPFYYDTDWISMDGLDHDDASRPGGPEVLGIRCTPDISRIQHFAFPFANGRPRDFSRDGDTQLDIFFRLDGLKSVGYYQPSFCIKRVSHWDNVIPQNERLFLKGLPARMSGPVSGPSLSGQKYQMAMSKLLGLIDVVGRLGHCKKSQNWHANSCDFARLNFCFLIHANSQAGLDLMKFKENGSHLDDIDQLGDLGLIGDQVEWAHTVAA